ncbi:uncharacterized protein METZ01_LOCUS355861, partial [marine metagenome]
VRYFNKTILVTVTACLCLAGCVASQSGARSPEPGADAADTNYQLGAQYYRNGRYALARDRLERSIRFGPRNANAHSLLALTLVELGNDRLANESFQRSVKLGSGNKEVRNRYAVYLCQRGHYDDALKQFDRAIRIRENDTAWIEMTNAGVCVSQKPNFAEAERYYRQALELRPTYAEALIQMAVLKHRLEESLLARAFLQRYLAANQGSAAVLYLAVQIETVLGDHRAATNYLNELLANFPESAEAKLM